MADSFESTWAARSAPALDWRWLCRLSLVEPAVAITWHAALLRSLSLTIALDRTLLLFVSLWLVYMADRLLDVRRLPAARRPRTERHRFVYDHPRLVTSAWCATFLVAVGYAGTHLTALEWAGGGGVCLLTALYLWFVHRRPSSALRLRQRGAKEFGVAILFVVGSTLFIWTHPAFGSTRSVVTLGSAATLFFAVALHNLLHLARQERHIDTHHGSPSIMWNGNRSTVLERLLTLGLTAAAVTNVGLVAKGIAVGGLPLAALLPITTGAALGSWLLLLQNRLIPCFNQDAKHLFADLAVLFAALPTLLIPAPFG